MDEYTLNSTLETGLPTHVSWKEFKVAVRPTSGSDLYSLFYDNDGSAVYWKGLFMAIDALLVSNKNQRSIIQEIRGKTPDLVRDAEKALALKGTRP